jgi:hypothetical protein
VIAGDDEVGHVGDSLGLYLLGALRGEERTALELHLAVCDRCRVEAEKFGTAADALALLSARDVQELMAEFEPPDAAAAPAAPPAPAAAATPPPVAVRRPAPHRPANRPRPASRPRPANRPRPAGSGGALLRRLGDRRTRALAGIAGLATVLVLSVGMTLGLALARTGGAAPPAEITLAATASAADETSGASLSVSFFGDAQGSTIRATVAGLHEGERYQLYAVASDGRTRVVRQWLGSTGVQDVGGRIELPATTLSFFTVTKIDGTTIVSAYLTRSGPSHTS